MAFNTVTLKCPKCLTNIEFQSRVGANYNRYDGDNAPPETMEATAGMKEECPKCHMPVFAVLKFTQITIASLQACTPKEED